MSVISVRYNHAASLQPEITRTDCGDGFILSSATPVPEPAPTLLHWLDYYALQRPDQVFLAERAIDGGWRTITYAEASALVPKVASLISDSGRGPVMLLSDNSVDYALVMLAALHLGVPAVPVSPAYSQSATFRRLLYIVDQIEPAVVFADDLSRYTSPAHGLKVLKALKIAR